jgi:heterodisulfide reductase subunit C
MADDALTLNLTESDFKKKVHKLLPEGNLDICLTCGTCSSGCPATGLHDMDPRKFVRMVSLGLDQEIAQSPWLWMCSMCKRCQHACPMDVDIPRMVYLARQMVPRDERPKGIRNSCDVALKGGTCSAMGASEEDFKFVVEDVLEEVRETQPGFEDLQAPINKEGATYFLNQNSREPMTEPDEMVPLWKIMHTVGADWTYGTLGWAAENYCMFLGDDEAWENIVRCKAKAVDDLGCKYWLNTE